MASVETGDVAIQILGRMYPELRKELQSVFDGVSLYEEGAFVSDLVSKSANYLVESRDYNNDVQEIIVEKPIKNKTRNSRK